jgi:glycosyltransferase involved in cell wall biosynthesis
MDIGIMPVPDRPFERGKCGYKLIQYMACGLPVVASPVGVNRQIVTPDYNGLLATSETEWKAALSLLISDADLRSKLGRNGRLRAVADYSLASHSSRLVEVFKSVAT